MAELTTQDCRRIASVDEATLANALEICELLHQLARLKAEAELAKQGLSAYRIEQIFFESGEFVVRYDAARCGCCNDVRSLILRVGALINEAAALAEPATA